MGNLPVSHWKWLQTSQKRRGTSPQSACWSEIIEILGTHFHVNCWIGKRIFENTVPVVYLLISVVFLTWEYSAPCSRHLEMQHNAAQCTDHCPHSVSPTKRTVHHQSISSNLWMLVEKNNSYELINIFTNAKTCTHPGKKQQQQQQQLRKKTPSLRQS